jgi:hypothetical protein
MEIVLLLDSFWACATPTDAATMIKAINPDTTNFFISSPSYAIHQGSPFWPPGMGTVIPHGRSKWSLEPSVPKTASRFSTEPLPA